MAFESLSDRLQETLKKVTGQATLTEANMEEMLREIRLALLEADVNTKLAVSETSVSLSATGSRYRPEVVMSSGLSYDL